MAYMKSASRPQQKFTKEAHERVKAIFIATAERSLREVTAEDIEQLRWSLMADFS
jgi:hypothetical protein